MHQKLQADFYLRDVLEVAPDLLGKRLVICGSEHSGVYHITEVEAYRGREDMACHASRGMTPRTEVMFREGGLLYMYLVYGMHWMMNIVTAGTGIPQAVLIRGLDKVSGPGRLTRQLGLDRSFNGESLVQSERIWLEDAETPSNILTSPRIGIDYAGEPWISIPWRYYL
ncbi:MAG: DNA-3-methyladenine glycosylase [Bacteroidales bacterium]|nr:DNA-3-methyladenine glycosylase [Bacteroidales bacterium]